MNTFKYTKTRDNGDATSNYNLSGPFPIPFKDFVTTILNQENSFRVQFWETKNWVDTDLECYKKDDGKWYITKEEPENWFKENANRNVIKSWANGGWGQMTYFITFEEANDNEIQTATND